MHTITSSPARPTFRTHAPRTTCRPEGPMYLRRTYSYLLPKPIPYLQPHTYTENTINNEKTGYLHPYLQSPEHRTYSVPTRTYFYILTAPQDATFHEHFPKRFTAFAPDGSPPGPPPLDHRLSRSHTARPPTGLPYQPARSCPPHGTHPRLPGPPRLRSTHTCRPS